ncbi:MAG TPA: hypothetical protein VE777_05895 [Gaiellales bacterium]|jgi:uncharacterized membrane protein YeaQ/YmgE (transglycosylase-associated protein family)|nr:hypothetical protein [Gaiellales bacterium]
MIWFIISLVVGGLIVGALGRLLHPGRDTMSVPMTAGLGILAMLVSGLVVRPILGFGGGFITAVIVAVVLVWAYAQYVGPRGAARV